jgi:hypothetical protein
MCSLNMQDAFYWIHPRGHAGRVPDGAGPRRETMRLPRERRAIVIERLRDHMIDYIVCLYLCTILSLVHHFSAFTGVRKNLRDAEHSHDSDDFSRR